MRYDVQNDVRCLRYDIRKPRQRLKTLLAVLFFCAGLQIFMQLLLRRTLVLLNIKQQFLITQTNSPQPQPILACPHLPVYRRYGRTPVLYGLSPNQGKALLVKTFPADV